ncbi:MAG: translocation/assembly module TamB, partial [bacterium]|nr:translocation/assembly module TamB [bacterium]
MAKLPLTFDAQGLAPGGRWRLSGSGDLAQLTDDYILSLDGMGRMGRTEVKTRETASLRFGGAVTTTRLRLLAGEGQADLDAELGGESVNLKARLAGVSLTAFDPDLAGDIDGTFNLHGQGDTVLGDFAAKLTGARERGSKIEQSLDARITGDLRDQVLTIAA